MIDYAEPDEPTCDGCQLPDEICACEEEREYDLEGEKTGKTLLGFQVADAAGRNIQGDDNCPIGLPSFAIVHPADAANLAASIGKNYLLMPIFTGTIEEPEITRWIKK